MNIVEVDRARVFSPEKMQKNNLFETDRFFCDVYCLEPGQSQAPHDHAASDKVYLVLEGEGTFQVGSEEASRAQTLRRQERRPATARDDDEAVYARPQPAQQVCFVGDGHRFQRRQHRDLEPQGTQLVPAYGCETRVPEGRPKSRVRNIRRKRAHGFERSATTAQPAFQEQGSKCRCRNRQRPAQFFAADR